MIPEPVWKEQTSLASNGTFFTHQPARYLPCQKHDICWSDVLHTKLACDSDNWYKFDGEPNVWIFFKDLQKILKSTWKVSNWKTLSWSNYFTCGMRNGKTFKIKIVVISSDFSLITFVLPTHCIATVKSNKHGIFHSDTFSNKKSLYFFHQAFCISALNFYKSEIVVSNFSIPSKPCQYAKLFPATLIWGLIS